VVSESEDVERSTARRLGLHPWRQVAQRYGGARPSKLKRAIVEVADDERLRWMQSIVSLDRNGATGTVAVDYDGRRIVVNERVVQHIAPHPERAPYLPWIPAALKSPLEVWKSYREGARGLEPRLYYLFAAALPEVHSVIVIVGGNDRVAFNMIPIRPKNARKFRNGELLFVGYDAPYGRCPHGCCESDQLA
jgi:hypothetical protein